MQSIVRCGLKRGFTSVKCLPHSWSIKFSTLPPGAGSAGKSWTPSSVHKSAATSTHRVQTKPDLANPIPPGIGIEKPLHGSGLPGFGETSVSNEALTAPPSASPTVPGVSRTPEPVSKVAAASATNTHRQKQRLEREAELSGAASGTTSGGVVPTGVPPGPGGITPGGITPGGGVPGGPAGMPPPLNPLGAERVAQQPPVSKQTPVYALVLAGLALAALYTYIQGPVIPGTSIPKQSPLIAEEATPQAPPALPTAAATAASDPAEAQQAKAEIANSKPMWLWGRKSS